MHLDGAQYTLQKLQLGVIDVKIKIGDKVSISKTTEVEPGSYVYKGEKGTVIDVTCPNYYLVKLLYQAYWVNGDYLDKIND